jgi:hypothetical protein
MDRSPARIITGQAVAHRRTRSEEEASLRETPWPEEGSERRSRRRPGTSEDRTCPHTASPNPSSQEKESAACEKGQRTSRPRREATLCASGAIPWSPTMSSRTKVNQRCDSPHTRMFLRPSGDSSERHPARRRNSNILLSSLLPISPEAIGGDTEHGSGSPSSICSAGFAGMADHFSRCRSCAS